MIPTITWADNTVKIIDQRKLPLRYEFITCRDIHSLWQAIKTLAVRGAPAIGIAAVFGVLLGIKDFRGQNRKDFNKAFRHVCDYLGSSRPTAVNLFNGLARMKGVLEKNPDASVGKIKRLLQREAFQVFQEDKVTSRRMGNFGARLVKNKSTLLTICNAGALATADYGTALGVMYCAKSKGKRFKVYACETRPLLQGARLTAWELTKCKIDTTLICDSMAAILMKQGKIDMIFAGADRIALNGDTANKIGTYSLAVLAKHHKIPFYIVAPLTTFDRKAKDAGDIPIEQRDSKEVTQICGRRIAPAGIKVFNPAFDITDNRLITLIITDCGIIGPPYRKNIMKILKRHAF